MKLRELLLESKDISIQELDKLTKTSGKPVYILLAGSLGSGKSFIVKRDLDVDTVDLDVFTMELGAGVYDKKNVGKAMAMLKKAIAERLSNGQTFVQQGTSANLQSTINKIKNAKNHGFITVLLYVDTPVDQAIRQVEKRVAAGGHGESIDRTKVEHTSADAKLTFRALSGVDFEKATEDDIERVKQAVEKTEKTLDNVRKNLDYFIRIENTY